MGNCVTSPVSPPVGQQASIVMEQTIEQHQSRNGTPHHGDEEERPAADRSTPSLPSFVLPPDARTGPSDKSRTGAGDLPRPLSFSNDLRRVDSNSGNSNSAAATTNKRSSTPTVAVVRENVLVDTNNVHRIDTGESAAEELDRSMTRDSLDDENQEEHESDSGSSPSHLSGARTRCITPAPPASSLLVKVPAPPQDNGPTELHAKLPFAGRLRTSSNQEPVEEQQQPTAAPVVPQPQQPQQSTPVGSRVLPPRAPAQAPQRPSRPGGGKRVTITEDRPAAAAPETPSGPTPFESATEYLLFADNEELQRRESAWEDAVHSKIVGGHWSINRAGW